MEVSVLITAYHAGWFEFRLAVPSDGGADKTIPVSQDKLNQHVLEIDPSTPDYDRIIDYSAVGGAFRCSTTAGYTDPTATSPNTLWPHGSCAHPRTMPPHHHHRTRAQSTASTRTTIFVPPPRLQ